MDIEGLYSEKIILASGSARRKEILESHGLHPVIMPMDVDETLPERISPQDAVMYLALKKGLAAENMTFLSEDEASFHPENALIISADTIVYARDISTGCWSIMGKPKDKEDARRMLMSINGTGHKVMTGVALISNSIGAASKPFKRVFYDSTDVYVSDISESDLSAYIESGEPFGKAGGYAIQLAFGQYVDHIVGDFENVVGFPYAHMIRELNSI